MGKDTACKLKTAVTKLLFIYYVQHVYFCNTNTLTKCLVLLQTMRGRDLKFVENLMGTDKIVVFMHSDTIPANELHSFTTEPTEKMIRSFQEVSIIYFVLLNESFTNNTIVSQVYCASSS